MLLGALLPSVDFDVNEYHFQGPKEFFQAGCISRLEHNVYTSFPFGTEMLTLLAMVLRDDWYRGALAGKVVLMGFGPLTALALFAAGRRWFGTTAGAFAAILYLSTPWVYRISTIAYAEGGLTFYLFAALLAVMIAVGWAEPTTTPKEMVGAVHPAESAATLRQLLLAGLLAGSAMACKYPGLISVVFPLGLVVCARAWTSGGPSALRWKMPVAFAAGVLIAVGPWLLKNAVETGNPVYPLAYRVFGGRDWDAAVEARWQKAHSPDTYSLSSLAGLALDVAARNDWVNPLLFALAPLALFGAATRRRAGWLWVYVGWLFLSCWLFTHRIDRFWVPLLPVLALLAGAGAAWWRSALPGGRSRSALFVPLALLGLFQLLFITSPLGGYNEYLADLNAAERIAAQITAPELAWLSETLPEGSKVLAVGDAAVFAARVPVVYNTVFDRSYLEEWCAARPGDPAGELQGASAIRQKFAAEGVTHVYVSWREIVRYRAPGNYGYSAFVTPERFSALQRLGILGPALASPGGVRDLDELDPPARKELETWGQGLLTHSGKKAAYVTYQVFPVIRETRERHERDDRQSD
jgi:4-amino-4-deoxy-L-arabinose transferase-like glycosyltransferase